MKHHRVGYNDAEWAELRRGPIAAIYRMSLANVAVAADLAHEFIAAEHAIHDLVATQSDESLLAELFAEGLSKQDLRSMVTEHCSAERSMDAVIVSAKLVRSRFPAAYDEYSAVLVAAARTAANAVKEVSIPGYRHMTEAEDCAIREIERALGNAETFSASLFPDGNGLPAAE